MVKDWLDLHSFESPEWVTFEEKKSSWIHIVHAHLRRMKAMTTLLMPMGAMERAQL
jgi:hypothetical protein